MPIKLITGLPGSGKSLSAVELLQADAARPDRRPIYAVGIDGLDESLAIPLQDPLRWQDLPDGSLVVVDEAQKYFPTRRGTDPLPPVRALSEHRHRGFDFVLVTQHPSMIDSYIRKLVGEHTHVVRRFGTRFCDRYTWGEVVDDPQSQTMRDRATKSEWRMPSKLFGAYRSASLHTVKARVPWKVYALPVVLILAAVVGVWTYKRLNAKAAPQPAAIGEAQAGLPAGPRSFDGLGAMSGDKRPRYKDASDYIRQHVPRVPGMPWSSPVFDDLPIAAKPDLYCIAVEAGPCICHTEQGTRYQVEDNVCRTVARYGVYNPHRPTLAAQEQASAQQQSQQLQQQQGKPVQQQVPDRMEARQAQGLRKPYDPGVFGPRRE